MRIVDCGMRIEKENPKFRNPQFEIRNSIGRCFLRPRLLRPGHYLSFPKTLRFSLNDPPFIDKIFRNCISAGVFNSPRARPKSRIEVFP